MMQRALASIFAFLGWFAVVTQYVLMIEVSEQTDFETSIRFFSFFTILTNTLAALYFTASAMKPEIFKPGHLTALTVYITVVGLVYQIALRQIWNPHGLQRVVDELLHSVIPVCTLVYWFFYEQKMSVNFRQIPAWLIYPACYFVFVLIRGSVSGFYPYPFIDLNSLDPGKVAVNAIIIFLIFVFLATLFVALGKRIKTHRSIN